MTFNETDIMKKSTENYQYKKKCPEIDILS